MADGSVLASWTGSYSRDVAADAAGPPAWLPLDLAVATTDGNWLFAVIAWRQDDGGGTIAYPSSVYVSDDAGNFWFPVEAGQPDTGVTRAAVWCAPAARAASYVFVTPAPTPVPGSLNPVPQPYQGAITLAVLEVQAACPWYEVTATAAAYADASLSVTATVTQPASGQFMLAVVAWDNYTDIVDITTTGPTWTVQTDVSCTNSSDTYGDMAQQTLTATTGSGTASVTGTRSGTGLNPDYAAVIIVMSGVTDLRAFPYATPLENWPALVLESASGQVLNTDPVFADGTTYWYTQYCTIAAATWPVYNPWPSYQAVTSGSVLMTPDGAHTYAQVFSGKYKLPSSTGLYTTLAYVYAVQPLTAGAYVQASLAWYDSSYNYLSQSYGTETTLVAGQWNTLIFDYPVTPPPGAVYGAASVLMQSASSDLPVSDTVYIGYEAFGVASAYENTPPESVQWTDFSSRNFTQQAISVSRGIQYEQQTLEAGTMTLSLANQDSALTFGNILSGFWPTIGDTDVPVRLRAVWPGSLTPYTPLFTGYTDDIRFGWDPSTHYGFVRMTCSDVWSRLTAQMIGVNPEEVLLDNPWGYWLASYTGTNLVAQNPVALHSTDSPFGAGTATATFNSSTIQELGNEASVNWQVSGVSTTATPLGYQGVTLTMFPGEQSSALPPVADSITLEFWFSPDGASSTQPAVNLSVVTCWSGKGPMWGLYLDNNTGSATKGQLFISTWDNTTGAETDYSTSTQDYLSGPNATESWFVAVTFTATQITVVTSPSGANYSNTVIGNVTPLNLPPVPLGFSFGGNAGPYSVYNAVNGTFPQCMNISVYGVAVFAGAVPLSRLTAHFASANGAFGGELDVWRMARIIGYSGFTPPMAMRGLSLPVPPGADLDVMTPATDTLQQIINDYLTNITGSTFAGMFVDGAGALVYRRRLEWYDRTYAQHAAGEQDTQLVLALDINPLNTSGSTSGWTASNGATFSSGSIAAAGPLFYPFAGVFHGNGTTLYPGITFAGGVTETPVTPGDWYELTGWTYSTLSWAAGMAVAVSWRTSAGAEISTAYSNIPGLPASSPVYLTTGTIRAPAAAAYALVFCQLQGATAAPADQDFYIAGVTMGKVNASPAGGLASAAQEAPYQPDIMLSADRTILYNSTVLIQYGQNANATFSASSLVYVPTSGVTVIQQNLPSILLRGEVPYFAMSYMNNTVQALPYYLDQPAIEDLGNWIVNTLGSPVLRAKTIRLTPAATPGALGTVLGAELGDSFTFRRRHLSNPVIEFGAYCSKISHRIDIQSATWNTTYELSPYQVGTVLKCDDPVHGTLIGGNYIAW